MVAPRQKLSPAEYLAWERAQPDKHEYFHGEVFAMSGGTFRHNAMCVNLGAILRGAMPRGCHVVSSDQRVAVDGGARYVYPDVTVVCGSPTLEHDDVLTNPTVVIEVLSRSTEPNDRGSKWGSYQRLASLTDYLLVPQWTPRIEHFRRDPHGDWIYRSVGPGEVITLASGVALPVDDVFAGAMDLPGDPPPEPA